MFVGLRDYQLEGVEFIGRHPKCGLFFDCGLGKTLTVLSAISHYRRDLLPALIVAPLRVAKHVWPEEITGWRFDLTSQVIHGPKKAELIKREVDVTICNPESLQTVINSGRRFRLVTVDESSRFKNWKTKRWVRLAGICAGAERVVLLTGTPIAGRGVIDLWAQFGLFGASNPLGSWHSFCERNFEFDCFNRPRPRAGAEERIQAAIAPWVLRKSSRELGDSMPGLVEIDDIVDMPAGVRRDYDSLKLGEGGGYTSLRTLASGFVYEKHWSGTVTPVWKHPSKLHAVQGIVDEAPSENILIFSCFTAEIDKLQAEFGAGVIDGRTPPAVTAELIQLWNNRQLPVIVAHPNAAGHGLNLQFGGHRIIWASLPDSGESYQQANARLCRSGQQSGSVFIHRLIAKGSIDEAIARLLAKKCLNEKSLFDAIEAHRKARSPTSR